MTPDLKVITNLDYPEHDPNPRIRAAVLAQTLARVAQRNAHYYISDDTDKIRAAAVEALAISEEIWRLQEQCARQAQIVGKLLEPWWMRWSRQLWK